MCVYRLIPASYYSIRFTYRNTVHLSHLTSYLLIYLFRTHLRSCDGLDLNPKYISNIITITPQLESSTRECFQKFNSKGIITQNLEITNFCLTIQESISTLNIKANLNSYNFHMLLEAKTDILFP